MNKRDPYDILGISPDSEMSVIEAAFQKLVESDKNSSESELENSVLSEIKWAYSELLDPNKRIEYRNEKANINDGSRDAADIGSHVSERNIRLETKSNVWSVLLSTGLFFLMIGAIGYGLYFVGAVRNSEEYLVDQLKGVGAIESSVTPIAMVTTGIPELSVMHTATVEALKTTATHEAVVAYSEGLTATNYAKNMPSATPTQVLVQACSNAISVNVRSGPSTAYTILGQLLKGDCVTVYGRNENSSWYIITESPRPSMNDGWVNSELIDMDSSDEYMKVINLE